MRVLTARGVPDGTNAPARGIVAGAAVLLSERLAVTCAHVVETALNRRRLDEAPAQEFPVDFPALPGSGMTARVADGGWFRLPPLGDLALLALHGPLPADAAPAPVGGGLTGDASGVLVYGHPATVPDGVWARARAVAAGGPHPYWLQLDGDGGQGARIERGFSGAGVWDGHRQQVIGVVAAVLDGGGQAPTRVAWMIPLGLLAGTAFAHLLAGWEIAGPVDAWDLVDALMETGAAASALLSVLPVGISGTVPRDDVPRLQLFHLVRRCGDFQDGPAALVHSVRQLGGDSLSVRAFVHKARTLWPDRLDGDA